jgi:unsaturated rhamnogalacturonyl hydrolase
MVKNDNYVQGEVLPGANNPVFKTTSKMFLKEISELKVKASATTIVTKENAAIIAVANYGKGTVFAVGDPWIYNEYIDNRKLLPADFENYKAAEDLAKWLLQTATKK